MKKRQWVIIASCLMSSFAQAKWFVTKDNLVSAHEKLLSGQVAESFEQMVQLWQHQPAPLMADNLDALLTSAIEVDCGISLTASGLPDWLSSLSLQRETVQHVNQLNYNVNIEGSASAQQVSAELIKWPEQVIVSGKAGVAKSGDFKLSFRQFLTPLTRGLYQLRLTANGHDPFEPWILLNEATTVQRIAWTDTFGWRIENYRLPMKRCPAPALVQSLYPIDKLYKSETWSRREQGRLPTEFIPELTGLSGGKYWLSISLVDSRWQGGLLMQDIQRLIKPIEMPINAVNKEVTEPTF